MFQVKHKEGEEYYCGFRGFLVLLGNMIFFPRELDWRYVGTSLRVHLLLGFRI